MVQGHVYDSIFKEAGHQKCSYAEWAHKSEIWDPDTLGGGESLPRRVSEPEKDNSHGIHYRWKTTEQYRLVQLELL